MSQWADDSIDTSLHRGFWLGKTSVCFFLIKTWLHCPRFRRVNPAVRADVPFKASSCSQCSHSALCCTNCPHAAVKPGYFFHRLLQLSRIYREWDFILVVFSYFHPFSLTVYWLQNISDFAAIATTIIHQSLENGIISGLYWFDRPH